MQRKFLTTTALVTLFFASTSFADGSHGEHGTKYKVELGGTVDAQAAFVFKGNGSTAEFGTQNNKSVEFGSTTEVHLKAHAKTDRGMIYGAHIGLTPNTLSKTSVNYFGMGRTYIFTESGDLGRIELGSNDGAGDMMTRGAGSIAAATGGVEGDYARYSGLDSVYSGGVIVLPKLSLDNATFGASGTTGFASEKSRKITYLSPKFSGVQVGVSYIPDTSNLGSSVTTASGPSGGTKNALSAGLLWSTKMKQEHHIEASVTGEWGQSTDKDINDTKALIAGATWKYKDFKVGGNFGWLDSTDFAKLSTPATSWFATLGAGMTFGKLYSSITGLYGTRNSNTSWVVSAGLDYELAAGFLPYVEATYGSFETKPSLAKYYPRTSTRDYGGSTSSIDSKSSGTALILGMKVKF